MMPFNARLWIVLVVLLMAALAAWLAACDGEGPGQRGAAADCPVPAEPAPIAIADPVENYMLHRHGSCLHAAVQDLLRWRGMDVESRYWRSHYGGGAGVADVVAIADRLHLHHAETQSGDVEFLERCARQRLGAAIYWQVRRPGDHAIVFCGYEDGQAVLLGVNRPEISRMPKDEFLGRWQACGGGAFTILP